MSYTRINKFGQGAAFDAVNDPVTYCIGRTIDNSFQHGTTLFGQECLPCQVIMSQRCAVQWDNICEMCSHNTNISYPNNLQNCTSMNDVVNKNMNAGQILLYNTFATKYLTNIYAGTRKQEPFDARVASSPIITYWIGGFRTYEVLETENIDNCIVMNKILDNPYIARDILVNIYKTMKNKKTLYKLSGTRLGSFFQKEIGSVEN